MWERLDMYSNCDLVAEARLNHVKHAAQRLISSETCLGVLLDVESNIEP